MGRYCIQGWSSLQECQSHEITAHDLRKRAPNAEIPLTLRPIGLMTPKKSFNDAVNNTQVRGSHASLMSEHAELMEATRDNARSRTSSGEPAPSSDALDNLLSPLSGTYRRNRPRRVGGIKMNHTCIPFLSKIHEISQISATEFDFRKLLRTSHQHQCEHRRTLPENRENLKEKVCVHGSFWYHPPVGVDFVEKFRSITPG